MHMNQNYCMVNQTSNTCENVVLWDGNPDTWTPPAGFLMLPQATTPAMNWEWDAQASDYVLVEQMGQGQIGFTWNGTVLTTNEPKPEALIASPDGPTVEGAQTL